MSTTKSVVDVDLAKAMLKKATALLLYFEGTDHELQIQMARSLVDDLRAVVLEAKTLRNFTGVSLAEAFWNAPDMTAEIEAAVEKARQEAVGAGHAR